MTVEEIDRVLYLPGHTREQVERALRIPALSPGWQGSMRTLLEQSNGEGRGSSGSAGLSAAATAPPPAWRGFRPLTVARIQSESRSVFSMHLAAADGSELPTALPGQFLTVSAGIGVTPVLAMLHSLAHGHSARQVWWLHGARNGTEHPFAQESRDLIATLPNARSTVYYSRPTAADREGVDYAEASRLSADRVRGLGLPTDADAYLCGPVGFMDNVTAALIDSGLEAGRIHTELFGAAPSLTPGINESAVAPAPHQPPGPVGSGPEVSFACSGLHVPWNDVQESLLELAEACDVPVQWSCRTGVCHTCELALMSGTVDYYPDPVEPPAEGNILICCSKPTDDVVLDL
ncbi:3-alpha domain-containing protein [Streptomyces sp. NBC_01764]|uniref:3-alpha domain-containing protein n=1 Tax=Streptomyces sp. NBC_01764 TaxID=2975935 RepID=UPI002B1CD5A4|nr:3-alpha domain-containing protein [Streptomyces sp. NBC_01764]